MKSYIYYFRTGKKIKYLDDGGDFDEALATQIKNDLKAKYGDTISDSELGRMGLEEYRKQKGIVAKDQTAEIEAVNAAAKTHLAETKGGVQGIGDAVQTAQKKAEAKPNAGPSPASKKGLSTDAKGAIADAGIAAINAVDNALMGDKNFGKLSAAIDNLVHGASKAMLKSGNPYAMCCCAGTKVYTNNGVAKNIEDLKQEDGILGYLNGKCILQPIESLFPPSYKECVQIETVKGNILRCSIDHPILSALLGNKKSKKINGRRIKYKIYGFNKADSLNEGDYVAEIGEIPIFGNKVVKDSYIIGALIGDGSYRKRSVPLLTTTDKCTWKYMDNYPAASLSRVDFLDNGVEVRYYAFKGFQGVLREHGIYGQVRDEKRLPIDINDWDKLSCSKLLSGLFDTDGHIEGPDPKHCAVCFSQSNITLIHLIKNLLLKFGIHSNIISIDARDAVIKGKKCHCKTQYKLIIKGRESIINFYNNIVFNIDYKLNKLEKIYKVKINRGTKDNSYSLFNIVADKIKRIIKLGYLPVYNLCAGISHTYIADNIVTHNTAAAALEGANFLTKAGGQTVQGFDVDINSSGYGNIGHMDSRSNRDFGAAIGLGGLNGKKIEKQLTKRNELAQMALKAANIADTTQFEQEARMNSVDNVIEANKIALAGGIDTSLLAAKHGGKLKRLEEYKAEKVRKAKEGAKLKKIEVSEEQNVIPEGSYHKNKHDLELDKITQKGIPVITVKDDTAETFAEIKALESTILQQAEIERGEVIFVKSLTDFIEENRKKYKESEDPNILLEVGKRLTKELLQNTQDNVDVIQKIEEKEHGTV